MGRATKILAVTGNRADYELMTYVYRRLHEDKDVDFRLLVFGAHLSETYGYSISEIHRDGFSVLAAIGNLLEYDSPGARAGTLAIGLLNAISHVEKFTPDLIMYAGDREDVMIGALLGIYLKIPTAHFFGGDHASDGNVDNPIRHAASKLSSVHFVTLAEHKARLLKVGESAERIHVIGSPQLDRFFLETIPPVGGVLSNTLHLDPMQWQQYALMIYHPILGQEEQGAEHYCQVLDVLIEKGIKVLAGTPNTDAGNKRILEAIRGYTSNDSICFYRNLERSAYLSLYKCAAFQIGNSSSGLLEAATIALPAINVGLRQTGRHAPSNVIFVDNDKMQISEAIDKALSIAFKAGIANIENPYGDGMSSLRAYEIIKSLDLDKFRFKVEDPL